MKRIVILIAIMILCTGCYGKGDTPNTSEDTTDARTFKAIVLSQEDNSLTVIVVEEGKGFHKFDPVSVRFDTSKLEVSMGDIIAISYNGMIRESYPCQIDADKVQIKEKVTDIWPATKAIPGDYSVEEAVEDNCYVIALDEVVSKDLLLNFIDNSQNGIIGFLRMVNYTMEGDPIITDILYDGEKYNLFQDDSRDKFSSGEYKTYEKQYSYVNTYEKDEYQTLYLSDRDNITDEEYEKSMDSNDTADYLDIYQLYHGVDENTKD